MNPVDGAASSRAGGPGHRSICIGIKQCEPRRGARRAAAPRRGFGQVARYGIAWLSEGAAHVRGPKPRIVEVQLRAFATTSACLGADGLRETLLIGGRCWVVQDP